VYRGENITRQGIFQPLPGRLALGFEHNHQVIQTGLQTGDSDMLHQPGAIHPSADR